MTSQIAERYAAAYFNVAKEKKILKKASSDFEILESIVSNFTKILIKINNPISTKEKRFLFVRKLLSAYKFNLITKNLLFLLAEYRCIDLLKKIIDHWNNLYLNFKNETSIEVVSVKKIKTTDLVYIKNFFEKKLKKKVRLQNTLDPSILGGVIIKFGSFILDGSIANKIRNIGFALKAKT